VTGARQTWLVAAREIRERSRSRAFLVSVLLMLFAVSMAIVLPAVFDQGPGAKDVGLTGSTPAALPATLQAEGHAVETPIRIHRFATQAEGERALRDKRIDVLVVDARQLEWRKQTDEQLKAIATGAIQLVALRDRAAAAGLSADQLARLVTPVPVKSVELGQVAGRSPDDETAAFIMTLVLFGAISTYGAMVLNGVVEEKSSRTVEVLLARMPARNLLAGKIAGIGLLGLAQVAVTATVAVIAGALVHSINVPAVRGGVVAWAVVWFLLGYALYATVFGTLGSLASRTEDASSLMGPITIVLVLAVMMSFATIGSAGTTWARIVSWFPVTAPMAMPIRIAMGVATWWDPLVAAVLTVATIAGLVVLGGRVYTRAILHTGATLSLRDAWRGTPAPHRDARRVTNRPSRAQLLLTVLAVIIAAVVFALTGDFIAGVAVGAAFFAVGVRGKKVWGGQRS
jgi:ABC-2 type transport system permease protein